ncbi:hypothetical protein OROMI_005119 [Orobanche minor]
MAWILCFKIRPSQEILKIRDGTPLEAEEILTHKKSSRNGSVWHFFNKLDDPSNIVQKESVARILFFKIRSFQEILKIHDGTPLEAEEILTHKKILETDRPSQEILKIRDGTPLESEEILTYIKKPPKQIGMALSSKLYVPNNVVQNKRVAWILCFKIRPSQEILKIRDGTPLESEEILTYIKKPPKRNEIQKNHDGTPLESEESLTYIKNPQNRSVWHFSSKFDIHNNVVHKKRVAWILFFKIRPSQEILKIRDVAWILFFKISSFQEILNIHDGTHFESEEILTYIKKPPKQIGMALSSKLYVPNNVVHKKRVAWILFFKIRPSQEILKIHDDTPLESEEILTYIKKPPKQIGMALSSKLYVPNNVVHKKRVAWILCFNIRSSQEILKIRDGTPLEAEEILTHKKSSRNGSVWHFFNKLDDLSNIVQKERVARILFFKIRSFQEILKIHDGTPLEAEEILTHKKSSRNGSVWHFFNKLDDPSNIVQKERVVRILFFKISSFQEILKIHDGTHFESEEILTYIKKPPKQIGMALSSKLYVPNNVVHKKRVAWILFFKIRPSQEILKIRDGTHLEGEEILTYIKKKALETDGNKRVARILFFKIRSSQEIQKNHDGTPLESEEILTYKKPPKQIVAWILFFEISSFQEILKIHDGTHFESEEILTYIKKPPKQIGMALSSKLYVPNNVVHKKRVAWILFFKIRPSQEILKIRDGTHLEGEEILTYIKKKLSKRMESSQEIQKNHGDRSV